MPPPPIRPPMWNQQPQIPGTDLPQVPGGTNTFVPPPPPGTSVSILGNKWIFYHLTYANIDTNLYRSIIYLAKYNLHFNENVLCINFIHVCNFIELECTFATGTVSME